MNKITATILICTLSILSDYNSSSNKQKIKYRTIPPLPLPLPLPLPITLQLPIPSYNINRSLSLSVIYPDGTKIKDVNISVNKPEIFSGQPRINENGNFIYEIKPNIPDGTEFTFYFQKKGVIFKKLPLVLDNNRITLPNGNFLYEKVATGYVPLVSSDIKLGNYSVSTCPITNTQFYTYYNGMATIPPENQYITVKHYGSDNLPGSLSNTVMISCLSNIVFSKDGKTAYLVNNSYRWGYILAYNIESGLLSIFAGQENICGCSQDGVGDNAVFSYPNRIAISSDGTTLYVTESDKIRKINITSREVTTLINDLDFYPYGIEVSKDGEKLYIVNHDSLLIIDSSNGNLIKTISGFLSLTDVAVSKDGSKIFVADDNKIKSIDLTTYNVSLISEGAGLNVPFRLISSMTTVNDKYLLLRESGRTILLNITTDKTDIINEKLTPSENLNNMETPAALNDIYGLAINPENSIIYTCDYGSSVIKRIIAVQ